MSLHPRDIGRTVELPRTLPAVLVSDFTPYHWVEGEGGRYSLRRGAAPKDVAAAAADLVSGGDLGSFLDRIGVPKQ